MDHEYSLIQYENDNADCLYFKVLVVSENNTCTCNDKLVMNYVTCAKCRSFLQYIYSTSIIHHK